VVSFSYASGAFTVGHGLNVAPSLIIAKHKNRSSDWAVYHVSLGKNYWLSINTTGAATSASNFWGTSSVSSTTFGGVEGISGISTDQDIAYCFAPVSGYSSMGSFVSNGTADNSFVYTGFRPRWIILKCSSGTSSWAIHDSSRATYNVIGPYLLADTSGAEASVDQVDFLSNGFKLRNSGFTNGSTWIYYAVAESPFNYARAR
jgi:hypothetical protein